MHDDRYVTVGKILKPQGNQGMLRVLPLTDFPERFFNMDRIPILHRDIRKILSIEEVYSHKRFLVMRFREVPDRSEAEKYKGALLQIPREQVMDLPENAYYIFDIIGCNVFAKNGKFLGTVKDVIQTGANDVYVVEEKSRRKPLLIPALKSIVQHIDPQAGRIEVDLPEGLEEL